PSLGIHRVHRRLALSHVLVVLVPVTLIAMLWVAGTVLGVGTERATVAARQTQSDGLALHDELRAVLDTRGDARGALAGWADALAGRWPRATVWVARDTMLERVRGDVAWDPLAVRGLVAALDRPPWSATV